MTTTNQTIAYRLTNIDTMKHRYFATLERAMTAGDKHLGLPAGAIFHWLETLVGFSVESQVGWQKSNGDRFYSIIPVEIEN